MIVYLNGQFLPIEDAKISVLDRGFIFGDAVYEVWRLVGGKLFEVDRHLARLASGLKDVHITAPTEAQKAKLVEIADRLVKENGLTGEGSLFLEMSRGVAPRAHQYPKPPVPPTVFLMASPFVPPEELRMKGAAVILIDDIRWKRCNVKTTQLLPNVMAKQEAFEHEALDAIFVRDGMVTETSHANVMAVVDGAVWTHPIDGSVLPGVTRDVVLELAKKAGIPVHEKAMSVDAFRRATEVFLVGTLSDVMPIVKVDGKQVGDGKPGPISLKLFRALRERLDATRG
ncbi:MAG: aminotransferase class IV [Gemmatimonadaceae bacterium]